MSRVSIVAFGTLTSLSLLAACGGTSDLAAPTVSDFSQMQTKAEQILAADGYAQGATFQRTGLARYEGYARAVDAHNPSQDLYVARVELEVNFSHDPVEGRLYDFATTLEGFERPSGEVEVSGYIGSLSGAAKWDPVTSGTLTQGDVTAQVTSLNADGTFLDAGQDGSTEMVLANVIEAWEFSDRDPITASALIITEIVE